MTRRPRKRTYFVFFLLLAASPLHRFVEPDAGSATSPVEKLQEFPLDQVQITDAYQQNLFNQDITYLITTLDPIASWPLQGGANGQDPGTPRNLYGGWENSSISRPHHGPLAVRGGARLPAGPGRATPPWPRRSRPSSMTSLRSSSRIQAESNGFLFATPDVPVRRLRRRHREHLGALLHDAQDPRRSDRRLQVRGQRDALAVASKLGTGSTTAPSGWSRGREVHGCSARSTAE